MPLAHMPARRDGHGRQHQNGHGGVKQAGHELLSDSPVDAENSSQSAGDGNNVTYNPAGRGGEHIFANRIPGIVLQRRTCHSSQSVMRRQKVMSVTVSCTRS